MAPNLAVLRRYAADHHGVVTGGAAVALGVGAVELLDLVLAGELELIAREVYRHPDVVTPLTEYAEAVALFAAWGTVVVRDHCGRCPRRARGGGWGAGTPIGRGTAVRTVPLPVVRCMAGATDRPADFS
ncbi:MAG: hypothetical protein JWQ37_3693 [Blastococcus sp.]|nr:hypothetical protein [Blastococcus sp.]